MVAANLTQSSLLPLRELCALRVKIYLQPGPAFSRHRAPKSCRIRTFTKPACNPCGMRSFKTQDLNSFRMRSFKKTGKGEGCPLRIPCVPTYTHERPFTPSRGRGETSFCSRIYFTVLWIPAGGALSANRPTRYFVTSLLHRFSVSNVLATDWRPCSPRRRFR
jgi:hypothetical protein